jgi:hypothetical protein
MVGARCDSKSECDERCLRSGTTFPGGFCTLSCLGEGDCASSTACVCAFNDDCIDREGGICLFECEADRDCQFLGEGWFCKEKPNALGQVTLVCIGG